MRRSFAQLLVAALVSGLACFILATPANAGLGAVTSFKFTIIYGELSDTPSGKSKSPSKDDKGDKNGQPVANQSGTSPDKDDVPVLEPTTEAPASQDSGSQPETPTPTEEPATPDGEQTPESTPTADSSEEAGTE